MARDLRVMVVDDSAVVRAILGDLISKADGLKLAASESNAMGALHALLIKQVDVIVLDIEMPGMNGLVALPLLLERSNGARILILSANAEAGGSAAVEALARGASDTMLKPRQASFAGDFGAQLVSRLIGLGGPAGHREEPAAIRDVAATLFVEEEEMAPIGRVDALGIGASTGGIVAITALLRSLPDDFNAPIFITQHLPGGFMPYFVEQLTRVVERPVKLANLGDQVEPGHVYVANGDGHLIPTRHKTGVRIGQSTVPAATPTMPAVDPMFASMAEAYGVGAVVAILTGMGRDGCDGAAAVRRAGGTVLAQDSGSSVVWGMPGAAVRDGVVDNVLTPEAMGEMLGAASLFNTGIAA